MCLALKRMLSFCFLLELFSWLTSLPPFIDVFSEECYWICSFYYKTRVRKEVVKNEGTYTHIFFKYKKWQNDESQPHRRTSDYTVSIRELIGDCRQNRVILLCLFMNCYLLCALSWLANSRIFLVSSFRFHQKMKSWVRTTSGPICPPRRMNYFGNKIMPLGVRISKYLSKNGRDYNFS